MNLFSPKPLALACCLLLSLATTAVVDAQVDCGSLATRAHAVSGDVVALSDRVVEFRDFNFDGNAPAAYYYASTFNPPRAGGLILLSTVHDCTEDRDLPGAYGTVTWRAEFPEGTSLRDFAGGSISVWCEEFTQNFGEVGVPSDLTGLPDAADGPALECFAAPAVPEVPAIAVTPEGYNCEPLSEDYQVRWKIDGEDLAVELIGRIEEDEYLGFGRSGRDDSTAMIGADPVVVDFFEGNFRARDFKMTARAQCSNQQGVCPDTDSAQCTNDAQDVSGERESGVTLVRFKKPLVPTDIALESVDRAIPVEAGVSTAIVWAIGPTDSSTGLPFFHSVDFARTTVRLEFGRTVVDNCEPLLDPVDPEVPSTLSPTAAPVAPFQLPMIRDTTEITARIGPSAAERGYEGITGRDAWGIAWYMNGKDTKYQYLMLTSFLHCRSHTPVAFFFTDILIPVIEMRRGTTYRFLVNGGDDPTSTAQYHPLYLTDSLDGGFAQRTPLEQADETIFAGVEITGETAEGVTGYTATAEGAICEYTGGTDTEDALSKSFPEFFATLDTDCAEDQTVIDGAGVLEFTPDENTPDLLYYQCVTHRNLGWEIRVIDADAPSRLQVSCENLREKPIELNNDLTLNAVLDPFGGTITVELILEGEAWLAMGFTNGNVVMPGSEAVIGLPDEGTVQKYNLNDRSRSAIVPMPEESQTLINATIVQEGGQTILSFTKFLVEEGEHIIRNEGSNTFLFAYGAGNTFGQHAVRGGFQLEPSQCIQILDGEDITPGRESSIVIASSDLNRGLWVAHGVFASLAWAILVPLAVGASLIRGLLESMGLPKGMWFQIHRALNSTAVVFTLIAFALAVRALSDSGIDKHFSELTHHTIGLIIFIFSLVQGINGALRPHLPEPTPETEADAEDGSQAKGQSAGDKSSARVAWEYGHRFLGVAILVCAWWQVQSGLELFALRFNEEDRRGAFWGVVISILAIVLILFGYQKTTLK